MNPPESPTPSSPAPAPPIPATLHLAKLRHDLRTPINHVIGYSEILLEDATPTLPAAFLTDLQRIRTGGHQLLALINHYLSDESLSAGALDLHQLSHDLRTPVNHIIGYSELLAEQCAELGHTSLQPDLHRITNAARTWLRLMEQRLLPPPYPPAPSPPPLPPPASHPPPHHYRPVELFTPTPSDDRPPPAPQGRLLLADDDPANRELLLRRLTRLGYEVVEAVDGTSAWCQLEQHPFDLALLDLLMPGLDGRQILAQLRAHPRLRHTPVIIISALDQMEDVVHCIELGAEDYLLKPFNPVLLRARVAAALEKKRLRDAEQVYLRRIDEERAKAERLLLNVLPRPIADRLKQGEAAIADSYADVTVLFADLVGFTSLSARLPPPAVVRLLDEIFTAFDELALRHGLEKIKTIGDAYMAVAGLPFPRADHAIAAATMARDMQATLIAFNTHHDPPLAMRVGLHTGPVIAGIVGRSKFIYDLWGDTVNTASRMESQGEPGRIQVSAVTAERLQGRFTLEARGPLLVRGKGTMETFFLA